MLKQRIGLACSILAMIGFMVLPLAAGRAGEKKGGKKKDDPPKLIFSKSDELTDKDEKDTKRSMSPRKVYKLKLNEGKTYKIDHVSKDFDAFLRLEDADGKELAFNDDVKPGVLDSQIVYKIAKTGEYRIIATTYGSDFIKTKLTGKFVLTVAESDRPTASIIYTAKATELKLKDGKARYEGELAAKSPAVYDRRYQVFTVEFEAGKSYRIDHRNNGEDKKFDAFLYLEDADGNELARDDDSGGNLNSRITHKAAKTGVYRIIATTLPPEQTGKFALEITTEK